MREKRINKNALRDGTQRDGGIRIIKSDGRGRRVGGKESGGSSRRGREGASLYDGVARKHIIFIKNKNYNARRLPYSNIHSYTQNININNNKKKVMMDTDSVVVPPTMSQLMIEIVESIVCSIGFPPFQSLIK